jgi:hypothetical protein
MYENANIETNRRNTMTLAKSGSAELTAEEWDELVALKEAINYDPASVHYDKMERFSELMVRSLEGKGDIVPVLKESTATAA